MIRPLRRTGFEEAGQRTILIACSEFPDSFYLAEQLIAAFTKAGWKQSKDSSPDQVWAEIRLAITVRAPARHPDVDLIARTLTEIIGSRLAVRRNVESPLPPFFDLAYIIQIQIGRKPNQRKLS